MTRIDSPKTHASPSPTSALDRPTHTSNHHPNHQSPQTHKSTYLLRVLLLEPRRERRGIGAQRGGGAIRGERGGAPQGRQARRPRGPLRAHSVRFNVWSGGWMGCGYLVGGVTAGQSRRRRSRRPRPRHRCMHALGALGRRRGRARARALGFGPWMGRAGVGRARLEEAIDQLTRPGNRLIECGHRFRGPGWISQRAMDRVQCRGGVPSAGARVGGVSECRGRKILRA